MQGQENLVVDKLDEILNKDKGTVYFKLSYEFTR